MIFGHIDKKINSFFEKKRKRFVMLFTQQWKDKKKNNRNVFEGKKKSIVLQIS